MQRSRTTYGNPQARTPDPDPKRRLFYENLGLVHMIVNRMYAPNVGEASVLEKGDLLQFGIMGLLDAAERFDPARGVQFSTYAVSRIRGAIQDALRKIDWIPRSVRRKARATDALTQKVAEQDRSGASMEEVMQRLQISEEEYLEVLERATTANIETSVPMEENLDAVASLATEEDADPAELAAKQQARELLIEAIEHLPERDRLVVTLYYYEELTFKEIGQVLKLSESRVFQIHADVLKGLRESLSER